jgi:hypothetical protein
MYIMSPIREHWRCVVKAPLESVCPVVLFDEKNCCSHCIAPSSHTHANKYHSHANNIMAHKWGQRENERDCNKFITTAGQQASIYFLELGAVAIGAKIYGTELMPRKQPRQRHAENDPGPRRQTCKLDVNYHGAEVRIYF